MTKLPLPYSLIRSVHQRKVIPFAGAGVSRAVTLNGASAYPNWTEFVLALAEALRSDGQTDHAAFVSACAKVGR
ncbi:MAG TPA: hypothetical protein VND93_04610, partial [Myxococcales bacterium]|nr:hypothetical protein [Myxococcales bacterium]